MNDPYQVLGVPRNATEEQIKDAYKQLARKYHPDNYANSPLADVATEKMQEINAAYDEIMAERRNGSSSNNYSGGYNGGYSGGYNGAGAGSNAESRGYTNEHAGEYADIRRLMQQRRFMEAEELLDGIPAGRRNAEWHFLKGTVYYNRGWLDNAVREITMACQMDPNNAEYRAALNQMNYNRGGGFGSYNNGGYHTTQHTSGMSACDCCSSLLCADCCCECMGGDLIPCC